MENSDQTATLKPLSVDGVKDAIERLRELGCKPLEDPLAIVLFETIAPDDCCARKLSKALRDAAAPLESWTCPKCGVEWQPEQKGLARHWKPQVWAARL